MKTLYLLRHAKSSWKHDALEDFNRPLGRSRSGLRPPGASLLIEVRP